MTFKHRLSNGSALCSAVQITPEDIEYSELFIRKIEAFKNRWEWPEGKWIGEWRLSELANIIRSRRAPVDGIEEFQPMPITEEELTKDREISWLVPIKFVIP